MVDLATMTDSEVEELRRAVEAEQTRRRDRAALLAREAEIRTEALARLNRTDGDAWQPPTALTPYAAGAVVRHAGRSWRSLLDGNVWEPGVSGWREVTEDGSVADWRQPTGAHDAYRRGDLVTFDGRVFESRIDANVWSPDGYPDGWLVLDDPEPEPEPDPEPEPEPEPEPDPEPEPEAPSWVQPTGGHDAYQAGDRVTYDGAEWVSTADANVWAPGVYGWSRA